MTTYRLFPSTSGPSSSVSNSNPFTFGLEFSLLQDCLLLAVMLWSAADAQQLPSQGCVYSTSSELEVPGTLASFPATGLGSGWLSATPSSPPRLYANTPYIAAVLVTGGVTRQVAATPGYYTAAGRTVGPISAPASGAATYGQNCYAEGSASLAFPSTSGAGENWWLDVQIQAFAEPGPGGGSLSVFW